MYKRALISVYDKTGLEEFLKPLVKQGLHIVSTGGTAQFLKSKAFPVQEVSELTHFPEILSGRVKTLHPHIFASLLAREWETQDQNTLKKYNIQPFDLLIVNLYPFAQKAKKLEDKKRVEWIDIGGPSLLRAGAKNYFSLMTICDPKDYPILQKQNKLQLRKKMAFKVFETLALYNLQIAKELKEEEKGTPASSSPNENPLEPANNTATQSPNKNKLGGLNEPVRQSTNEASLEPANKPVTQSPNKNKLGGLNEPVRQSTNEASLEPANKTLAPASPSKSQQPTQDKLFIRADFFKSLRYGENPHQTGQWFKTNRPGLHEAKILQGKALSYNNLLDFDNAVQALNEFKEPCVVAVKHNNPCGIGADSSITQALKKALTADPLSVFGALLAINRPLDQDCAQQLKGLFLEGVIAPAYSPSALQTLQNKKNLRLLELPTVAHLASPSPSLRPIQGGFLIQSSFKNPDSFQKNWQIQGDNPPQSLKQDLLFALKVCTHLKSNAIAIVKNQQTLGLGMGQVNRVDAVQLAIQRFQQFHPSQKEGLVLASDAFFPFVDSISLAHQAGIRWIIQPGGSIRDKEVLQKAKSLNINMILTGKRLFKH